MASSIRQSFLAGLLALLPIFITWKILSIVFQMVDGVLGDKLNQLLRLGTGLQVHIPGLGLLVTLVIVVLIGWATRLVFFKRILLWIEATIERVPIVRSLYNASRQIVVPFTDKAKLPFSQVVLVEYPMPGRHTLGLVAKARVTDDPDDDRVVVFFPSNHLHLGYPVVMHRADMTVIDMSVEEAVKFFVSCGVIGDDRLVRSGGQLIDVHPAPRTARAG
ncbi:MAG: DUF502 domain-containing protein [Myxococcota bacterium]